MMVSKARGTVRPPTTIVRVGSTRRRTTMPTPTCRGRGRGRLRAVLVALAVAGALAVLAVGGTVSVLAAGEAVDEWAPVEPQAASRTPSPSAHIQRHRGQILMLRGLCPAARRGNRSGELQSEPVGLHARAVAPVALGLVPGVVRALQEEL